MRSLFVAGEHCDSDTVDWSSRAFGGVPVIDHWWQTETGSPITSSCLGLGTTYHPAKGSSGLPVPGWDRKWKETNKEIFNHVIVVVCVVDENGNELKAGELGNLVARLPLPPGAFITLWRNERRYIDAYFTKFKVLMFSCFSNNLTSEFFKGFL